MTSEFINDKQIRGLLKIGDIMVPGDKEFPSFSESGCVEHVDDLLRYLDEGDLGDLKMLLSVFAVLPRFVCRALIGLFGASNYFPNFIAGLLRFADLGVKGVVFTLYYSGKQGEGSKIHVFDVINYHVKCDPVN